MTQEEFDKLPSCIRYKDPSSSCRKLDNWDGECCSTCTGFKYFAKEYYGDLFTEKSYEEVLPDE